MPPKPKFTREEIISAALETVKKKGAGSLTARELGNTLGTSARPIFTAFKNMEEVRTEVYFAAEKLHDEFLTCAMKTKKYPQYKASGMAYIRFAEEEKELFRLLFMNPRTENEKNHVQKSVSTVVEILKKSLGLDEPEAVRLHTEMWIYVHGIAVMVNTGYLLFDEEFAESSLTDVFEGLKARYCGNK